MNGFNKLERMVLRADTRRRDLWRLVGRGAKRKQMVQMHVAKSAGSTIKRHLVSCFGSHNNGVGVRMHDNKYGERATAEAIAAARAAPYVTGHISWNLMRQVSTLDESYVFTVFRSPTDRVRSLYNFLSTPVLDGYNERRRRVHLKMQELTPIEFLQTEDPELMYLFDNICTRQFSGGFDQFPVDRESGPRMLDTAIEHLEKLDYIALTETLDFDVRIIMKSNNLPSRSKLGKSNSTADRKERSGHQPRQGKEWNEDADEIAHALLRWDIQVYEFALAQRRA